jgi:hypothetical protein
MQIFSITMCCVLAIFQGMGSFSMDEDINGHFSDHFEIEDAPYDPLTAALRQMHDDIAGEPIPLEFLALLDQIDEKMSALKKQL